MKERLQGFKNYGSNPLHMTQSICTDEIISHPKSTHIIQDILNLEKKENDGVKIRDKEQNMCFWLERTGFKLGNIRVRESGMKEVYTRQLDFLMGFFWNNITG